MSGSGVTTQINTLLASLPNQYQLAGSTSSFAVIQGITGSFTSLGAATGSFTSVVGANYYNSASQLLTTNPAVYVGSCASTGAASQLLYTTIMTRGTITPSYTGSSTTLVNGLALSPGWTRAQYSLALTIPAGSTVKAQCSLAGTVLSDSLAQQSNIAPTSSIGVVTAAVQSGSLIGVTHFVNPTANASFTVSLTSTAGVPVVSSGSLEVFQLA